MQMASSFSTITSSTGKMMLLEKISVMIGVYRVMTSISPLPNGPLPREGYINPEVFDGAATRF
jgi:hypothetical protein